MKRSTAAILIAIMFLLSVAVPVMAQGYQFLCTVVTSPDGTWSMSCTPWVPTPLPTAQPTATATNTPAPTATATPQPMSTAPVSPLPTPTATATHNHPMPTATSPVSPLPTPAPTSTPAPVAAWQCPTHDKTKWHPHYNAELKCWYDHVHGSSPNSINYRFGAPWAFLSNYPGYSANAPEWNIKEISYPWQTGGGMESEVKHGGYKWVTFDTRPQNADVLWVADIGGGTNWLMTGHIGRIVAGRYQEHFGSAFAHEHNGQPSVMYDPLTRFHSIWVEVATNDGGRIGGGGWTDTGAAWQYFGQILPGADDPKPFSPGHRDGTLKDPYRAESLLCEDLVGQPFKDSVSLWTSRPAWVANDAGLKWYEHNNHLGIFSVHKDPSVCLDTSGQPHFRCEVGNHNVECTQNNTNFGPFRLWAYVSPAWDGSVQDRDSRTGWVTMYTWTDRKGLPAPTCMAPGLDCVPFYAVGVKPGWYVWETEVNGQGDIRAFDYDQSPDGRNYINLLGN